MRDAGALVVWLNWGTRPDRANLPPGVLHVYDPDGTGVGIGSSEPTGAPRCCSAARGRGPGRRTAGRADGRAGPQAPDERVLGHRAGLGAAGPRHRHGRARRGERRSVRTGHADRRGMCRLTTWSCARTHRRPPRRRSAGTPPSTTCASASASPPRSPISPPPSGARRDHRAAATTSARSSARPACSPPAVSAARSTGPAWPSRTCSMWSAR